MPPLRTPHLNPLPFTKGERRINLRQACSSPSRCCGKFDIMRTIIVTGSAGLIGSETVRRFAGEGARVIGIDNDMRKKFFGAEASTKKTRDDLIAKVSGYEHHDLDIRDTAAVTELFKRHSDSIGAIVHTASQPSHDWAARDPQTDFTVNANGTLNLLEAARQFSPEAPFIFTSTNKVYGDTPNRLPLRELEKRWEIEPGHEYEPGISETMSIDYTKHSLFGASKVAGDIRHSNCSKLEAIEMCEEISGKKLNWTYEETHRIGDHIWWISDVRKFQSHYPNWKFRYGIHEILEEIHRAVAGCCDKLKG